MNIFKKIGQWFEDHPLNPVSSTFDSKPKTTGTTYEERPRRKPPIEMEKRIDPNHPYCTNWPVGDNKDKEQNEKD